MIVNQKRKLAIDDSLISHIEGFANYSLIHRIDGKKPHLLCRTLKESGRRVGEGFIRIHRRYIVNQNHVSEYTIEACKVNVVTLPISRRYQKQVKQTLLMP